MSEQTAPTAADLIASIERAMRISRHTTDKTELWTRDDCAQYLKISKSSIDKMISRGEFAAARLRVTPGAQGDRWIPSDVIQWVMGRQFQAGRPRAA